jgi:hypothetical protein
VHAGGVTGDRDAEEVVEAPMSVMANSKRREAVIWLRSRVEEAVRMMSSTYSKRKALPSVH